MFSKYISIILSCKLPHYYYYYFYDHYYYYLENARNLAIAIERCIRNIQAFKATKPHGWECASADDTLTMVKDIGLAGFADLTEQEKNQIIPRQGLYESALSMVDTFETDVETE